MCFRFLQVACVFARTGELPHTDDHARSKGSMTRPRRAPTALDASRPAGSQRMNRRDARPPPMAPRRAALVAAAASPWRLAGIALPATRLIIFALLFGLMLTGMPVSISLGLTVLTYLFYHDRPCRSSRSR